ncbi:MAG: T9SS type A sorting domain-containing protein, partial [Flavobacteriaceae bacterium]|nr:T9SS type A sorting domain-containing protein [Flavobacteriaceae bacterium]
TINFTGGGGGTFTVTADSGTVDLTAGNPTTDPTGTITITGVAEGTDVILNVTDGSICDVNYTIYSADCEPALELPFYEGFDYAAGEYLENQANWTGFYSGDNILVGGPGGLTYSGLATQTGNHISFDGSGIDNKIEFTGVTSGEVYASFIFNITDQSSITDLTDGGYFAALAAGDSSFDTRVWVHPNTDPVSTTFEISITNASSGAVFAGTYNVGDNVLIVLSYAPGVGTVKGWVNPTSLGGAEPTPDFSETDSSAAATIDRFIIRQDSAGETPSILFDELRIGTSFSEVTPTTLSNEDFISDAFKLFPNPAKSGFVNISSTGSETIQANVYDILGKQVINAAVANGRLNVSTLNRGVYIVKLTQGAASTTKKLIIQ